MTSSVSPDFPVAAPAGLPLSFSGRGREFLNLLIKGSLLLIPTFGFYRFWLVTRLRRHLWSNTRLAGDSFEYTGTAKELLIGFLIAAAILVPIYIGYFIIGVVAEEAQALASIPLIAIIYVLAHFASYRARRYRASRTVFRGLRFWMTGAGWAYAARAILWDFAVLLTLGLALPWATASLERYRMRHTYFGTIQGDFVGSGWTLFKRGWWIWAVGVAIFAVGGRVVATEVLKGAGTPEPWAIGLLSVAYLLILVLAWLAASVFTRWQMEGLRFGDLAVSCNLGLAAFIGIVVKLVFSSVGFVIVFAAILTGAGFLMYDFLLAAVQDASALAGGDIAKAGDGAIWAGIGLIAGVLLAYLVLLLGLGVIYRYFLERGVWAVVVNSLTVMNIEALDSAMSAGQTSGFIGEGFADALDFDVGI